MYKKWIICIAILTVVAFLSYNFSKEEEATQMHRGINIGNALEAPKNQYWGVTMTEEFFDKIAEQGFDTVRLPVRFCDYVDKNDSYKLDEEFMQKIDEYINHALSLDLTLILDFHHFVSLMETASPDDIELYYSVWTELANRYKDYPDKLIFELLNEPCGVLTARVWNEMMLKSLEIVRETNKTRRVIISPPEYSSVSKLNMLAIPNDENIIVSFHYYNPVEFAFQNNANHNYITGETISWTGTQQELEAMENDFKLAQSFAEKNGVKLFLGEFGTVKEVPEEYRIAWTKAAVEFADKYEIPYAYWELCSDFGVYNANTKEWNEELLETLLPEN